MNKNGNVYSILGIFFTFSVLSVFFVTLFIIQFGVTNDYILYNLQEQSELMESQGMIPSNYSNMTQMFGDSYKSNMTNIGDNLWFILYIMFILSTLYGAYVVRSSDEITGFMFLFYGVFLFLFLIGIISTFTDWVIDNVINKMLPDFIVYFPKFEWYVTNIGVISLVHCILLYLITKVNLNFAKKSTIDQREVDSVMDSDEVN